MLKVYYKYLFDLGKIYVRNISIIYLIYNVFCVLYNISLMHDIGHYLVYILLCIFILVAPIFMGTISYIFQYKKYWKIFKTNEMKIELQSMEIVDMHYNAWRNYMINQDESMPVILTPNYVIEVGKSVIKKSNVVSCKFGDHTHYSLTTKDRPITTLSIKTYDGKEDTIFRFGNKASAEKVVELLLIDYDIVVC